MPLHRYINGEAYATAEDSLRSVLCLLEACPELGLSFPLHKPEQTNETPLQSAVFGTAAMGRGSSRETFYGLVLCFGMCE